MTDPVATPAQSDATNATVMIFVVMVFFVGCSASSVCMGGLALGVLAAKALGL